ncbi:MAG: NTP transferase domain-containing protein [Prevotellaceae bacterium]|nr:NTP transferase domain-containing protein [Prevotellaceae bacterium]
MKFAIIAAGEGSRLASEGINVPKPLIEVGGEKLIDRLIRIFMDNEAEEIVVICNDRTNLVSQHLLQIEEDGLKGRPVNLRFKVKSTPSSMHSFFELSSMLGDGPFVLTTVDTVFKEAEFSNYAAAFKDALAQKTDGLMGVTSFVDDESPLWVGTRDDMTITGFYDHNDARCQYISAGIYGLTSKSFPVLARCVEAGESRMRNFQRALVRDGYAMTAWPFSKVFDIDHVSDIQKAETFLSR